MKLGSFDLPLRGSGAKYGESVSINNLSFGIFLIVPAKSMDFLNVTIPLTEIYEPKSKSL